MNLLGLKIEPDRSPTAKIKWTRRSGVMGAAIVLVAGTGIAYATWSASGSGAGAAKAGTATGVTATAAASVVTTGGTLLFPGTSVPAVVNITNPNNAAVTVTGLTITAEAQPDNVTGGTGCTAANSSVSLSGTSPTGLNVSIPANSSGTVVTGANVISMLNTSNSGCQGATFIFTANVAVTAQVG